MPKIVILGSGHAIASEGHENTHLAILGEQRRALIDCPGSPTIRLPQAGIEPNSLTDLILTHFHPDHIGGVPSLLMSLWLMGRREPLEVHGLAHTLDRVRQLMGLYDWETWPNFYPLHFHTLPAERRAPTDLGTEFRLFTSPVHHLVPTIGLRLESAQTGGTLAYSCDTEPCAEVVELASGVDILIHEAAGPFRGHSSPSQAGGVAARAEAGCLYLIHYNPQGQNLIPEAQKEFPGPVFLAEDFMTLAF